MATKEGQVNPPSTNTAVSPPIFISTATFQSITTHENLINHLRSTLSLFSSSIKTPVRHAHQTGPSSSLLLMPSWSLSTSLPYTGVKLVAYHPENSALGFPTVHSTYALFNSLTGQALATMDGTELTNYRTASISAVASSYLSRDDSNTLLMVGAGSLAPHLIKAHLTVRRNLKKVVIWNRTHEKARILAEKLSSEAGLEGVYFESCASLEDAVKAADIISCATNSETALVKGVDLKAGAHLDLVGSFTHSMRECDEAAIGKGRVFIDNEAAVLEAGELVNALKSGVIRKDDIPELVELIRGEKSGRKNKEEITVFKSVGSAMFDLLSAQLVYDCCMNNQVKK